MDRRTDIELGLGLVSIGRTWGHRPAAPPSEGEARRLLECAVALGIRFFDTAPAYGTSQRTFGAFVKTLGDRRADIVVATKMGEHWNSEAGTAYTDHSFDALRRSLDRSVELLGSIDLLQIHKANVAALASEGVSGALDYARSLGIQEFGASVSDLEAARLACGARSYGYLQFPFNRVDTRLAPAFEMAEASGMRIIVNRPFAMGRIIAEAADRHVAMRDALGWILEQPFQGFVLTGTKSAEHLRETQGLFQAARSLS
jgi:aryl-alcohol dehydrogenase-like predicted oxidoreductase